MKKTDRKVIFLDIDGVLNWTKSTNRVKNFVGIDPECVLVFNKILKAHKDAKIVISSTWRMFSDFGPGYEGFKGLKKLLKDHGLKGRIIGHTPYRFPFGRSSRGGEIREWMEENSKYNLKYVILDDDRSGMEPPPRLNLQYPPLPKDSVFRIDLRPRHVVTSFYGYPTDSSHLLPGGLRDEHAEEAIRILDEQN